MDLAFLVYVLPSTAFLFLKQFKGLHSVLVCGAREGTQGLVHTRKHSALWARIKGGFRLPLTKNHGACALALDEAPWPTGGGLPSMATRGRLIVPPCHHLTGNRRVCP